MRFRWNFGRAQTRKVGSGWLGCLVLFLRKQMLDKGRWRIMAPLYKNKGDIQNCNNYKGIKLLSHTMKVWDRVVEMRVRRGVFISRNQFGFMPGRSTTEAIYLVRRSVEKYGERKRDLPMMFSLWKLTNSWGMSSGGAWRLKVSWWLILRR